MATAGRKTDDVLAAARKALQAQLGVVREEQARLAAEEAALTHALASLNGAGSPSADRSAGSAHASQSRTAKPKRRASSRRRPRRGRPKSTADRLEELRALLVDGPRSRNDLAAALKVSPARVQQLLAELGSSVSSRPDPERGRGKLWALKGSSSRSTSRKGAAAKQTT